MSSNAEREWTIHAAALHANVQVARAPMRRDTRTDFIFNIGAGL
jgi:hypothetical protein